MKLGFSLPTAGAWGTPENQLRITRRAEALGYHSLWVFQRLLYALEPKNPYPPAPGPTWPKPFQRVMDPTVTLAFVAGATTRIRLGTSVPSCRTTPFLVAKQLATLDIVSGGRLDVGLGIGWSMDKYGNFDPDGATIERALEVMEALAPARSIS
jgi:alkanesulfonate monooxygenase SsuD/methylene tetrahydromethanopterin reductase-like flavin-dependent oxidoreductase (luciferase family)